jgi:hypothetical protein
MVTLGRKIAFIRTIGTFPIRKETRFGKWTSMGIKSGQAAQRIGTNEEEQICLPRI